MKFEDIQSNCPWMVANYGVNKKNACSVVSTPTHLNTCRKEKCGFWAWHRAAAKPIDIHRGAKHLNKRDKEIVEAYEKLGEALCKASKLKERMYAEAEAFFAGICLKAEP